MIEKIIEKIIEHLEKKAKEFGAKDNDYILRKNTGNKAFDNNSAYFGFIHPEEETSGPYHDFSFVVFPSKLESNDEESHWVVCLGIGSLGFKNDYELATFPGVRRLFNSIIDNNDSFCKTDFSDIETSLSKEFLENDKIASVRETLKKYKKVLPVCQIIKAPKITEDNKINEDKSLEYLEGFLAAYAKLRSWATNGNHRDAISESISKIKKERSNISKEDVKKILSQRKFIVLEGAPGTGKTRMAYAVADDLKAKIFFTQFHAETSYSDFIWGLRPKLNSQTIIYEETKGKFVEALELALKNEGKDVILIIDEINRANLSNVLGPIFYLFEYQRTSSNIEIEITPNLKIKNLPKNFFVIATMNTADRSLAVVDFALRRRFAWITMKPEKPKTLDNSNLQFYKEDFERFDEIFQWYASSNELNLQPGQAYFIAENNDEMKNRIEYELLPLIKEYLQEGMLLSAKEEFNIYFQSRIQKSLFE